MLLKVSVCWKANFGKCLHVCVSMSVSGVEVMLIYKNKLFGVGKGGGGQLETL